MIAHISFTAPGRWNTYVPEGLSAELWLPLSQQRAHTEAESHPKVINKQSCVTDHLPGKVHPLLNDFFGGETSAYDPNKIRLKQEQKYIYYIFLLKSKKKNYIYLKTTFKNVFKIVDMTVICLNQ